MLLLAKRATADLCIIKSTKNNQSIKPVNPVNNSRTRSVQRCCLMTIVKNFESVSLELTHINDYTFFFGKPSAIVSSIYILFNRFTSVKNKLLVHIFNSFNFMETTDQIDELFKDIYYRRREEIMTAHTNSEFT